MTAAGLVHEALLYGDPGEFLAGTVPFVEEGLARNEPVMVATVPANLALLRAAVPATADRVRQVDMRREGRNPGRILPAVLLSFVAAHPGRRVRIVGEPVWPGRSPLEYPACVQHEALINTALAGRDAAVLCPYDVAGLDQPAIDDAERTHPLLTTPAGSRSSPRFADPVVTAGTWNLPLPAPPVTAETTEVVRERLGALRERAAAQARAAGLPPARVVDVMIAVSELASNTIDHAAGSGTLASWREGGYLVCQVTDRGHIRDPLAGRLPPPPDALSGRGLFVVNQICDLVRIHTAPGGTTVRIHVGAQPAPS